MIIKAGEKVHVVQRRLFETDVRRHFVGAVVEGGDSSIRVRGYSFVFDKASNQYVRRPEQRERVVSLVSGNLITNILPSGVDVDKVTYKVGKDGHLCVTDGETFSLDINEFGAKQ